MQELTDERVSSPHQQEAFRVMFEQAGFGVAQLSIDGQWLEVNQSLCDILGYSRAELLSRPLSEITRFDDVSRELADCLRLLEGQIQSFSSSNRHLRADGRVAWLKATITLVRDQLTGAPHSYLAVVEDLTPQRVNRIRTEAALQRQVDFDELMTRALTQFTTCSAAEVHSCVVNALKDTAKFIGVDHAYVLVFSPDRTAWGATHEWCSPGLEPQARSYQNLPLGSVPWSEGKILSGEVIRINTLADFPPEAVVERLVPDVQAGMQSILLVPVHGAAGVIAGAVGFDSHARAVVWSDDDVARCRMVGDAIATVLERMRTEEARTDLSRRLMTAQEAERTRIARELHDGIGQSLALLSIQMQRAGQPTASGRKNPGIAELCAKLKEIGNQLSRLSHQLHSSELEFLGLAVAVKSLCREFSEQYRIKIDCVCKDIPSELDNDVALGFLRVVQEALHNIAKHSRASEVQLELVRSEDELVLAVADNGVGFDMNTVRDTAGLGMISMRERMHLIGGQFNITSKPGGGTRIQAKVRLPSAANGLAVSPRGAKVGSSL